MTCGLAVKRPHDYENFLASESGVEIKRPRSTNQHLNPQCSPFRPQLGTLAQSLMQANNSNTAQTSKEDESNPFINVSSKCQLSSNQLESYLRAEIQYLKRRKLIPKKPSTLTTQKSSETGQSGKTSTDLPNSSNSYRHGAISPSSCHSGSDSDGEASGNSMEAKVDAPSFMEALYEKPQFSLKQVKLICERLLKEQENRLRYEFEGALNKKLDEKHEQYIQFAKEQLETTRKNDADFFYLS